MQSYKYEFSRDQIARGDVEALLDWSKNYPNFSPHELACKCCGDLIINKEALWALQYLRQLWKRPMIINSAYRCPKHNQRVGGAVASYHLQGRAFDVSFNMSDAAVVSFIYYATVSKFRGFGLYLDAMHPFIHIDTGPARTWQRGQSRLDDHDDVTEL